MQIRFLVLICIILLYPLRTFSSSIETRTWKDAGSLGMGNAGVSAFGTSASVIRNPANLGHMTNYDIAPFLTVGISVSQDFINTSKKGLAFSKTPDPNTIIPAEFINTAPSIGINGPLMLGYMGKGFGIWTTSSGDLSLSIVGNKCFIKNAGSVQNILDFTSALKDAIDNNSLNPSVLFQIFKKNLPSMREEHLIKIAEHYTGAKYDPATGNIIGGSVSKEMVKKLAKDLIPKARYDFIADMTLNIGYGYKIPFASIDNVSGLSIGTTLRFSQRFKNTSGNLKYIPELVDSFSLNSFAQGYSISSDFGLSLRIKNWIFGLSARDAFSSSYSWKNFNNLPLDIQPSKLRPSLDFGTSYRFLFNGIPVVQELAFYLEFEDSLDPYTSWADKVRFGIDFQTLNFLNLRLGVYDQFITAGIGMAWKWFQMDFAYYRENYFNLFHNDFFYLNLTLGLNNTPTKKQTASEKKYKKLS